MGTLLISACGLIFVNTLLWGFLSFFFVSPWLMGLLHISSPLGLDVRAGSGSGWIQEHPERPPSLWERAGRPRQIQNPATDPTGQHQAEDRRVRSLVNGFWCFTAYPFWMISLHADTHLNSPEDLLVHTRRRRNRTTAEANTNSCWVFQKKNHLFSREVKESAKTDFPFAFS